MFDQILQLVKEHMEDNTELAAAIPADSLSGVYNEIAEHISHALKSHVNTQGGSGEMLSMLQSGKAAGSPLISSIESSLIGILTNKYHLPPAAIGAIVASLPELLQQFAYKTNDPNDAGINKEDVTASLNKEDGEG